MLLNRDRQTELLDQLRVGNSAGVLTEHSLGDGRFGGVEPGAESGDHSLSIHEGRVEDSRQCAR